MNLADQVKEKIAHLEELLTSQIPSYPTALRDIHALLKKDEEIVTLLTEEEIAVIVTGLKKQTNTVINTAAKKAAAGKSLKSMTLADL